MRFDKAIRVRQLTPYPTGYQAISAAPPNVEEAKVEITATAQHATELSTLLRPPRLLKLHTRLEPLPIKASCATIQKKHTREPLRQPCYIYLNSSLYDNDSLQIATYSRNASIQLFYEGIGTYTEPTDTHEEQKEIPLYGTQVGPFLLRLPTNQLIYEKPFGWLPNEKLVEVQHIEEERYVVTTPPGRRNARNFYPYGAYCPPGVTIEKIQQTYFCAQPVAGVTKVSVYNVDFLKDAHLNVPPSLVQESTNPVCAGLFEGFNCYFLNPISPEKSSHLVDWITQGKIQVTLTLPQQANSLYRYKSIGYKSLSNNYKYIELIFQQGT